MQVLFVFQGAAFDDSTRGAKASIKGAPSRGGEFR
jgi:hypothetical protein